MAHLSRIRSLAKKHCITITRDGKDRYVLVDGGARLSNLSAEACDHYCVKIDDAVSMHQSNLAVLASKIRREKNRHEYDMAQLRKRLSKGPYSAVAASNRRRAMLAARAVAPPPT